MKQHLNFEQLSGNLTVGKSVEQWLGAHPQNLFTKIKWIRIDKEKDEKYSVTLFEVFDDGNEDFLDIYEFSPIDPDEPYGITNTFSNIEDAISYSVEEYSCKNDKFLNAGLIQDEYKEYLKTKNY